MAEFLATYGLDGVVRSVTPRWMFLTAPICIAALVWSSIKRRELVVYRWLLVLGFGYLAWNMNRNASLYAIVWGFILSGVLGDEVKNYNRGKSIANEGNQSNGVCIWASTRLYRFQCTLISGGHYRKEGK